MSEDHFIRFFHARTGQSPAQYVLERRLHPCRRAPLVLQGQYRVDCVSLRVPEPIIIFESVPAAAWDTPGGVPEVRDGSGRRRAGGRRIASSVGVARQFRLAGDAARGACAPGLRASEAALPSLAPVSARMAVTRAEMDTRCAARTLEERPSEGHTHLSWPSSWEIGDSFQPLRPFVLLRRPEHRRIHYNFHTPHWARGVGADFDGPSVIDTLRRANVNEVTPVFGFCSCGNAYWDTERDDLRHPGLAKDMVAELLGAAKGSGVSVSIHFAMGVNNRAIERHPDWAMVRSDGSSLDGGPDRGWAWPCLNSPHIEENVWPLLREFLRRYQPDGLFMDMITFADKACYCRWCLERMRNEGCAVGDQAAEDAFRVETIDRVIRDTLSLIRAARPDIPVAFNNQWRFGRLSRRRDALDFIDVEAPLSWVRSRTRCVRGMPAVGACPWPG